VAVCSAENCAKILIAMMMAGHHGGNIQISCVDLPQEQEYPRDHQVKYATNIQSMRLKVCIFRGTWHQHKKKYVKKIQLKNEIESEPEEKASDKNVQHA